LVRQLSGEMMQDTPISWVWSREIVTLFPELFPGGVGAASRARLQEAHGSLTTHRLRGYGVAQTRNVEITAAAVPHG